MYFAVSDVHSFTGAMLYSLYSEGFEDNNPDHKVILCGDAFDRGSASKSMFSWLKNMSAQNRLIYIRGNHEDLLEQLVYEIRKFRPVSKHHISNGTVSTLAQIVNCSEYDILGRTFDWAVFDSTVDELLKFINENTVDYFQIGKTVFVHGWVPTTSDENKMTIVDSSWRDGNWSNARWENGQEMFHFNIFPEDVDTVVVGHWHASYGWCKLKNACSEWGPDAIFTTMTHTNSSEKRIVALDACTAYTHRINVAKFDAEGNLIE